MAKKKTVRRAPKPAPTPATPVAEPAPLVAAQPTPEPVADPMTPHIHKHGHKLFLGAWAYIVGLIVATAAAIIRPAGLDNYTIIILAVFGVVVGLMNITEEEVLLFLVASLAFVMSASSVRLVLASSPFISTLMNGIIIFTAAGAFVVSFKALFKVAKSE